MALNEVDEIGEETEKQFETLLAVSVDQMVKDFQNGGPLQIRNPYLAASTEITTSGMVSSIDYGLGESWEIASIEGVGEHYLSAPYYGNTLSNRLYKNANAAQAAVTATVNQHIKAKTTWQKLAKAVNKPHIRADVLPDYITSLDKALKEYGVESAELKRAIKKAKAQVARFTDKNGITRSNLKTSYSRVISAAERGEAKLLGDKLSKALKQKAINNSEMLAKSEISRAYFEAEQRKLLNDGDVIGWRSVLSSAHPRPDICNYFAEVDGYGMGRGVSPVAFGNPIGYHSRCICQVEAVYKNDKIKVGKYDKSNSDQYFKDLKANGENEKLESMLGKKGSNNIDNWENSLHGWQEPAKLSVLPKALAVKKS